MSTKDSYQYQAYNVQRKANFNTDFSTAY